MHPEGRVTDDLDVLVRFRGRDLVEEFLVAVPDEVRVDRHHLLDDVGTGRASHRERDDVDQRELVGLALAADLHVDGRPGMDLGGVRVEEALDPELHLLAQAAQADECRQEKRESEREPESLHARNLAAPRKRRNASHNTSVRASATASTRSVRRPSCLTPRHGFDSRPAFRGVCAGDDCG